MKIDLADDCVFLQFWNAPEVFRFIKIIGLKFLVGGGVLLIKLHTYSLKNSEKNYKSFSYANSFQDEKYCKAVW